jgi:hypothetical protein
VVFFWKELDGKKNLGPNSQTASWGLTELLTSTGRGGKGGKLVIDLRNEVPLIKIWPMKKEKSSQDRTIRPDDPYSCPVYTNRFELCL